MMSILRNAGFGVPEIVSRQTKRRAGLHVFAVARAQRGPRRFELRGGEAVLRDPQRERALFQQRRAVGRLRDRAHPRGERHREDRQRDEDLD